MKSIEENRIEELKKMGRDNGVFSAQELADYFGVSLATGKRYMQDKYRVNIDRFQAHNEKFGEKIYGKYKPQWVVPYEVVVSVENEEAYRKLNWKEVDKVDFNQIKQKYEKYNRRDLLVEIEKLSKKIDDLENEIIILQSK